MEKITFICAQRTCCSVELHWNYNSKENEVIKSYKIYQKEGGNHYLTNYWYFQEIYSGTNTCLEINNLKQNQNYTFKLEVIKKDSTESKIIEVKTLIAPYAILSENSLKIANGEIVDEKDKLQDFQQGIIQNCSKLIFEDKLDNVLEGDFNGIKIKLTHEIENNIYYFSFDFEKGSFYEFFKQYLKQCDSDNINNVNIPCHFIIEKLPTLLILNFLEKGAVIFTGKRMGGMIASSLAFYIMYIGKSMNVN